MASTNEQQPEDIGRQRHKCFKEWMDLQDRKFSELSQALSMNTGDALVEREALLRQLAEQNIKYFQDYSEQRISLACVDVSPYFSPSWCSLLERSLLWLGGCRPSILIGLVYALCGVQIESQLTDFLQGIRIGSLSELSTRQLVQINDLQSKTIQEETKLSDLVASLQERIADTPMAVIAGKLSSECCEPSEEVNRALDEYMHSMVNTSKDADKMRLNTLKELLCILTPDQGANYLAAGRKLHLCIHEWGKRLDRNH